MVERGENAEVLFPFVFPPKGRGYAHENSNCGCGDLGFESPAATLVIFPFFNVS
jgi:hypothetical protein